MAQPVDERMQRDTYQNKNQNKNKQKLRYHQQRCFLKLRDQPIL